MTETIKRPVGRKRKHAEYEELLESVSAEITKRPKYVKGIGLLHGYLPVLKRGLFTTMGKFQKSFVFI